VCDGITEKPAITQMWVKQNTYAGAKTHHTQVHSAFLGTDYSYTKCQAPKLPKPRMLASQLFAKKASTSAF
jgi:hypothetical protein